MNPLRLLAPTLALSLGCDDASRTAPAPARVVAVTAEHDTASDAEFCDVTKGKNAPVFSLPPLDGQAPKLQGPLWVNVWATWCPPCIEELPRLQQLVDTLKREGISLSLALLSADDTRAALTQFQAQHPETATSLRISNLKVLEPWLARIGLDRGATLPIHLFVDANGKIACARTGSVHEDDLKAIAHLFGKPSAAPAAAKR